MTQYDDDLLKEGILRFKTGEMELARSYFERALATADDMVTRAQANLYLGRLTDDPQRKRRYLEETLAADMSNAEARRELAILDGRLKREQIIDPEHPPAPQVGEQQVQADRFTCPQCGGRMSFTPDGSSLYCEYCARRDHIPVKSSTSQQDFFIAMADGRGFQKTVSVKTFQCRGCGASFLLPPNQLTATCAYCGSNHVLVQRGERELLQPDVIIPPSIGRDKASRLLEKWLEKLQIQPEGTLQPPAGLFLPVWSFDISGSIPWKGKIEKDKQEVPVSGEKTFNLSNLAIPAAFTLRFLLGKSLPGYDWGQASSYDPRFLAGWPAEIPETSMSEASLDARQAAVEKVRACIKDEFGMVHSLTYTTSGMSVFAYKLALVPVWVTQIVVRGQTGRALINGCDGSIHSDLPGLGPGWLDTLLEGGRLAGKRIASRKKSKGT